MNLTLKVWRQKDAKSPGRMVEYQAANIIPDMSFLEMLDVVNEGLIARGEEPIAFDSDCREGICGTCSLVINGIAHGGQRGTTACQLHMRHFQDGQTITIEPWRAKSFPVLKDLVTDRGAFDRIIQAGGFVSVNTGGHAGCQCAARREGRFGPCHGCGGVHRLRRVRGGVQERVGNAVRFGEGFAFGVAAAREGGTEPARAEHGPADGCGGIRELHRDRFVRSGLSEGDQFGFHRAIESGIWEGAVEGRDGA